jgi:hypothetical protein
MKISKRDWAQLSAYLDGELSQRDLSKIKNRIEDDPVFQAALEDLRNVKTILNRTPRLSVPRNFTLKPSLVESPQRRSPARGYRLAAAALSFLFVGVVVFDLGSGMLKSGLSAAQAPRAEEVMLEAAADEMEEPAMMMAKEAGEEEIAPAAEMEEVAEVQESYEYVGEAETEGLAEPATNAVEEEADRASGDWEDTDGGEAQDLQNTLSPEEEPEPEGTQVPPDQEMDIIDQGFSIPWLRILEVTFGLGAVGFGVAAWINKRKKPEV